MGTQNHQLVLKNAAKQFGDTNVMYHLDGSHTKRLGTQEVAYQSWELSRNPHSRTSRIV